VRWFALLLANLGLHSPWCHGASANVAVATNFRDAALALAEEFSARTGHELKVSAGSTGKLYAQIRHGAPFHIFLAADQERPRRLQQDGLATSTPRTYALGSLVLIGSGMLNERTLAERDFHKLAIANPELAPYGMAATQVIEHLGVGNIVEDRIVQGENIGQTLTMVLSGNAELGLVARALASATSELATWSVPTQWHEPIAQDGILLPAGTDNPAAVSFYEFLYSPSAQQLIHAAGYEVP